jgi:hypothetical protein
MNVPNGVGEGEGADVEGGVVEVGEAAPTWRGLLRLQQWRGLVLCQGLATFGFACKIASIPVIATAVLPGGAAGAGALLSAAGLRCVGVSGVSMRNAAWHTWKGMRHSLLALSLARARALSLTHKQHTHSGLLGAPLGGWISDQAGTRVRASRVGDESFSLMHLLQTQMQTIHMHKCACLRVCVCACMCVCEPVCRFHNHVLCVCVSERARMHVLRSILCAPYRTKAQRHETRTNHKDNKPVSLSHQALGSQHSSAVSSAQSVSSSCPSPSQRPR